MKKILLTISALSAALFSTAANADVGVSGSANAVYVDAGGNSEGQIGGAVTFALSTVTDAGVSITASAALSNDTDAAGGTNAVSGLTSLTFGFANGSLTVADDVANPDGIGLVGELVTHADTKQATHTNDVTLAYDDGSGVKAVTSIGDMTLTAVYTYDGTHANDIDGGSSTGAGVSLSMPVGAGSFTVGTVRTDAASVGNTDTGAALTMPMANGTVSIGAIQVKGDTTANEGDAYSIAYKTTLSGASVSLGYTTYSAAGNNSTKTEAVVSSSLGGGASIFAEYSNLTGSGVAAANQTTSESVFAIGTKVSF